MLNSVFVFQKFRSKALLLLITVLFFNFSFSQTPSVLKPEGISNNKWKQAMRNWERIRFQTSIHMMDSSLHEGQLYSVTFKQLVLWPDSNMFIPGKDEDRLIELDIRDITSIQLVRKRNFWRAAWITGATVGFLPTLVTAIESDDDFLNPAILTLITAVGTAGPAGLVGGLIYRKTSTDKQYDLRNRTDLSLPDRQELKKYALFPGEAPEKIAYDADHPLAYSESLQQIAHCRLSSRLMRRVFPFSRLHIEGRMGYRFSNIQQQFERVLEESGFEAEKKSDLIPALNVGVSLRLTRRLRSELSFQIAAGSGIPFPDWKEAGKYANYYMRDPIHLGLTIDYMFSYVDPFFTRKTELSAGAGLSMNLIETSRTVVYRAPTDEPDIETRKVQTYSPVTYKYPGLLLNAKAAYFPIRIFSLGIKGELNLLPSVKVGELNHFRPDLGEGITLAAHKLNFSSATLSAQVGLHF